MLAPLVALPPISPAALAGHWTFRPVVVAALVLAAAGYALGVGRARRRPFGWSGARSSAFAGGLLSLAVVTCSGLDAYGRVIFWPQALADTCLLTITPVLLGLGTPIALAEAALPPRAAARLTGLVHGRAVRALTFPLVGSLGSVAALLTLWFTPYLGAALRHPWLLGVAQLELVAVGALFTWPMLGLDVPGWFSPPARVFIGFVDGLLDAVPGIFILGSRTLLTRAAYPVRPPWALSPHADQQLAGTIAVAIAELVGLPFLVALVVSWLRSDALDAATADAAPPGVALPGGSPAAPILERPWWEVDPGPLQHRTFEHRARPATDPPPTTER